MIISAEGGFMGSALGKLLRDTRCCTDSPYAALSMVCCYKNPLKRGSFLVALASHMPTSPVGNAYMLWPSHSLFLRGVIPVSKVPF